ncbi:hypothetical protein [Halostagnicola sp. A-GB9-2]|uniref:DUF7311 family protein n=1 Tax=Halostagnicola sp. A-GB9-2 TaxID=3048066 RepID=UPI0024BFBDC5|nr:hypothetical protein [Halostagnicola sp. A-GB9-2]MDJ1431440.1 hypothetical protein [Halostagnicola sp. A-GB9-2]
MIRYVLAVILAVALLVLSVPAIDLVAGVQTERQLEGDVSDLEDATVSLFENEEVSHDGTLAPQRTVTLTFPDDSLTTVPADYVRIDRVHNETSIVSYSVDGRSERQQTIDAPIVSEDSTQNETVELGGSGEETTIVLRLETDAAGDPVVTLGYP